MTGIFFLTMGEYLTGFWPELTEAHDLLESLELSEKNVNIGKNKNNSITVVPYSCIICTWTSLDIVGTYFEFFI